MAGNRFGRRAMIAIGVMQLALPAHGAAPPADNDSTITVTATADKEIADFVGALTAVPGQAQLSRFEGAVCPAALGIPAAQKIAVVNRMRAVATAAGIRTGKPDCRANVLLMVTNDRKALFDKLSRFQPGAVAELSRAEWRALRTSPEPAVAWHIKGPPVDADGAELLERNNGVTINRTAGSASRIVELVRPQFDGAVVIVNQAELKGLTTTQLADYAAMRAYLDSDPARLKGSTVSSILRILDAADNSEVPVTLTEWDFQALRGYYSVNRSLSAAAQRSGVAQQVKDKAGREPR